MVNKDVVVWIDLTRIAVEAVCSGLPGHDDPSVMMIIGSFVIGDSVKFVLTSLITHPSARNQNATSHIKQDQP